MHAYIQNINRNDNFAEGSPNEVYYQLLIYETTHGMQQNQYDYALIFTLRKPSCYQISYHDRQKQLS